MCKDSVGEINLAYGLFEWLGADDEVVEGEGRGYSTEVPGDFGSESYFDRLWKNGDR